MGDKFGFNSRRVQGSNDRRDLDLSRAKNIIAARKEGITNSGNVFEGALGNDVPNPDCLPGTDRPLTLDDLNTPSQNFNNFDGLVTQSIQGKTRDIPIHIGLGSRIAEAVKATGVNGLSFNVTSGRQAKLGSGGKRLPGSSTRHDEDNDAGAADGHLVLNGRILRYSNIEDRRIINNFIQNFTAVSAQRGLPVGIGIENPGVTKYMGDGVVHLDNHGGKGGNALWAGSGYTDRVHPEIRQAVNNGSNGQVVSLDQVQENPENQDSSAPGNTGNANCSPNNGAGGGAGGGGCAPASAGLAGVASSIMQGKGLSADNLLNNVSNLADLPALGASNVALNLAQNAMGNFPSIVLGGLTDPLSQITSGLNDAIQSIGGNILPSLTGVVPSLLAGQLDKGMLTNVLQNTVGSIIQSNVPQLGEFIGIFNSAVGAAGSAANLKAALLGSVSKVFGNVEAVMGNIGNIPGFDLTSIFPSILNPANIEGFEGMDSIFGIFQNNLSNRIPFVGNIQNVLSQAINNPSINGFSSLFNDFNSMVTQGFGNLTDNIVGLGNDLMDLGRLGDLTDLVNIGTPQQVVRQIVESGLGVNSGVLAGLQNVGLSLNNINDRANTSQVQTVLNNISDRNVIQEVKNKLNINDKVQISNLGDLTKTDKILPRSYNNNKFNNLNDIALTLALCGGTGRLKNYGDLGRLMANLETAERYDSLKDEVSLLNLEEFEFLKNTIPAESRFEPTGPVIADFIGSAAGYVHNDTLPILKNLLEEIFASSELQNYQLLMQLLTDTLSGVYLTSDERETGTDPNTNEPIIEEVFFHDVPDTAGYTFGEFFTMEDAVSAIKNAIEAELTDIKENLFNTNPELANKIQNAESLHYTSADYLANEKRMRGIYGIDFGIPERSKTYRGDGVTTQFPLSDSRAKDIKVYVNGLKTLNFSYSDSTGVVSFSSALDAGDTLEINYTVPVIPTLKNPLQSWQFASNLESLALQTGYGGPADFLSRMATNDRDGERIKAVMMQARNKERFNRMGINCPGFNRISGLEDEEEFNFIERTGIWSANPERASEIWLQRKIDTNTSGYNEPFVEYRKRKFKSNFEDMNRDIQQIYHNLFKQLIFYSDGFIGVSPSASKLYIDFLNNQYQNPNWKLSDAAKNEGYILGNYIEITTEMLRTSGLEDENFSRPLSDQTRAYLTSIGVDIKNLSRVIERSIIDSTAELLGFTRQDLKEMFDTPNTGLLILRTLEEL